MDEKQAVALRKPFPKESIGKLPKPYRKDSEKGNCPECGGYHGLPAVHLDYAGHAAVTERLLTVDPEWSWEPMALDQFGSPQLDRENNLWIRLTICGITRLGCGDGPSMKERIGDAIRNAAMRFGVGLDLWAKDNLVEFAQALNPVEPEKKAERVKATEEESPFYDTPPTEPLDQQITTRTNARMFALFGKKGPLDAAAQLAGVNQINSTAYTSRSQITERSGLATIAVLEKRPDLPKGEK